MIVCKYSGELWSISNRGLTIFCVCRASKIPRASRAVMPEIARQLGVWNVAGTCLGRSVGSGRGFIYARPFVKHKRNVYLVNGHLATICIPDCFNQSALMHRKIFFVHDAATTLYDFHNCLCNPPSVEAILAFFRDDLEGPSKVRILHYLTG